MKHVRIKRQTRIFWSWNFLRGNLSSTTGQKMKIIKLLTSQYIIQNKNFRSWNDGGKKILKDLRQSPWIITSNHSLVKAKIGELQNVQNFKGVKATKANYKNRAQSNKREIIKKKKIKKKKLFCGRYCNTFRYRKTQRCNGHSTKSKSLKAEWGQQFLHQQFTNQFRQINYA